MSRSEMHVRSGWKGPMRPTRRLAHIRRLPKLGLDRSVCSLWKSSGVEPMGRVTLFTTSDEVRRVDRKVWA